LGRARGCPLALFAQLEGSYTRRTGIAKVMLLWAISPAWDRRKARSNIEKHGVSFEEAQTVFLDENARLISDPDDSADEDRFVLLGYGFQGRCLVVHYCYRRPGSIMRLISARRASPKEEKEYWRFR
jgi:uncharacterized protein